MIRFFYAPLETTEDGLRKPVGEIPPSVSSLHFDEDLSRFVLRTGAGSTPIPSEWSEVDQALIEIDYPGIIGG